MSQTIHVITDIETRSRKGVRSPEGRNDRRNRSGLLDSNRLHCLLVTPVRRQQTQTGRVRLPESKEMVNLPSALDLSSVT